MNDEGQQCAHSEHRIMLGLRLGKVESKQARRSQFSHWEPCPYDKSALRDRAGQP